MPLLDREGQTQFYGRKVISKLATNDLPCMCRPNSPHPSDVAWKLFWTLSFRLTNGRARSTRGWSTSLFLTCRTPINSESLESMSTLSTSSNGRRSDRSTSAVLRTYRSTCARRSYTAWTEAKEKKLRLTHSHGSSNGRRIMRRKDTTLIRVTAVTSTRFRGE